MKRKEGYYVEHNGDCWQSVFPSSEASKSQLHDTVFDAMHYMHGDCGIPITVITLLDKARPQKL